MSWYIPRHRHDPYNRRTSCGDQHIRYFVKSQNSKETVGHSQRKEANSVDKGNRARSSKGKVSSDRKPAAKRKGCIRTSATVSKIPGKAARKQSTPTTVGSSTIPSTAIATTSAPETEVTVDNFI